MKPIYAAIVLAAILLGLSPYAHGKPKFQSIQPSRQARLYMQEAGGKKFWPAQDYCKGGQLYILETKEGMEDLGR